LRPQLTGNPGLTLHRFLVIEDSLNFLHGLHRSGPDIAQLSVNFAASSSGLKAALLVAE